MTTGVSESEITWILGRNLEVVWETAQRQRRQKDIDRIANEFDPDILGVLTVAMPNGTGKHHIIDGGVRHAAIVQLMGENQRLPCIVVPTGDIKRAAEIFVSMNAGRTRPSPIELFLVRLTAGYPDEVATNNVIEEIGYVVSKGSGERNLRAVVACLGVYKNHGSTTLRETLRIIRDTWGYDQHGVEASIIRAYGKLISAAGPKLNGKRLVEQMSKDISPGRLINDAKTRREASNRGSVTSNIVICLIIKYNKGLRSAEKLELPE